MKRYYVSQYLNLIELENSFLLFNGATGCLDEVSKKLGLALRGAAAPASLDFLNKDEILFLNKRGHISEMSPELEKERFREIAKLLHAENAKKARKSGSLMMLMSYNCNLNCDYCYQKPIRGAKAGAIMSESFVDNIFGKHFQSLFPGLSAEDTNITFYGGEPFLPAHKGTVKKILSYADRYGMHCGAISNSTQIENYKDCLGPHPGNINFVQVSLDGDKFEHDRSRIASRDIGTFDKIISNLHMLLDKKVRVNVRINTDITKVKSLDGLLAFLKSQDILFHPQAYVYIHPLHNHFNQTEGAAFMTTCQLSRQLSAYADRVRHPIARRADGLRYLMQIQQGIALAKTGFCMQCMENSYVLDAFGDIYGCYEEAGRDEFRIGHVSDNGVEFFPLKEKYLARHVENIPKCVDCSVAMACGGGCGALSREKTGNLYEPYCDDMKEMILEAVKYLYGEKFGNSSASVANFNLSYPNL